MLTAAPIRLLLVVALLLAQAPLLPAMILGAAALDGGHRIECGLDEDGLTLRLAHRVPVPRADTDERHSCLLRIFIRESSEQQDHQFRFTPASDAVQEAAETPGSLEAGGGPLDLLPPPGFVSTRPMAREPRVEHPWSTLDHPVPPALDRLRTVVMRA